MLDETQDLVRADRRSTRVDLLNAGGAQAIEQEWETAVLYALLCAGADVRYEYSGNGAPPFPDYDVVSPVAFLAEATGVSDRGYHEANPVDPFVQEFFRRAKKLGVPFSGFSFHVGSHAPHRKIELKVPKRSTWHQFFDSSFTSFMRVIRANPQRPARAHFEQGGADIKVEYAPSKEGIYSVGYSAFTHSSSLKTNPIYSALKRKRDQLIRAKHPGPLGIILCDAKCDQLRTSDAIVREFFRETTSVSFVAILEVSESAPRRVTCRFFGSSKSRDSNLGALERYFREEITAAFPPPIANVATAANIAHHGRVPGIGHWGGWTYTERSMRISSLALHQLLAGKVSCDAFMTGHGFAGSRNPFLEALSNGRTIRDIKVERLENEDDDWLVFEFSERDAAVSPLRVKDGS